MAALIGGDRFLMTVARSDLGQIVVDGECPFSGRNGIVRQRPKDEMIAAILDQQARYLPAAPHLGRHGDLPAS